MVKQLVPSVVPATGTVSFGWHVSFGSRYNGCACIFACQKQFRILFSTFLECDADVRLEQAYNPHTATSQLKTAIFTEKIFLY